MSKSALRLYEQLIALSWYFNSSGCDGNQCQSVSMTDFLAMRLIHHHQHCPVQTIGQTLGITKSGATRVAKRLEQQGLINISISEVDARVRCLSLTQEGNQCMDDVIARQTGKLQQHLDSMGSEQSQQLIQGLDALMTSTKS